MICEKIVVLLPLLSAHLPEFQGEFGYVYMVPWLSWYRIRGPLTEMLNRGKKGWEREQMVKALFLGYEGKYDFLQGSVLKWNTFSLRFPSTDFGKI